MTMTRVWRWLICKGRQRQAWRRWSLDLEERKGKRGNSDYSLVITYWQLLCKGWQENSLRTVHINSQVLYTNTGCYVPGHLAHIFLSFSTDMYLYDHMTLTHMTAYLYNRAASPGTPLFPPFVRLLLFPSYGSLWPPLFVTLLFCDAYCSWPHCSPYLHA